jgi:hypothetical protein
MVRPKRYLEPQARKSMLTRLNTFFRRLAVVVILVALALAASATTAWAQCQGPGCLTAETATMDLIPVTSAPVAAIATISVAPPQAMCDFPPDCLSAQDVLATTSAPSLNALPVEAPAAEPAEAMCIPWPDCLSGVKAGDR